MKNIVKVLLEKGIDEETIHEVLSVITEAEIPDFIKQEQKSKEINAKFDALKKRLDDSAKARKAKEDEKEAAKQYQVDSKINFRQNVKHGKNTLGPEVK